MVRVTPFEIVQLVLRILFAVAFIAMGINHFRSRVARGMAAMIPPFFKRGGLLTGKNLVRFTGVCEIAGGIGLLLPWTMLLAGILLAIFLVAVYPANHYASNRKEQFGKAAYPKIPRLIAQIVAIILIIVAVV